MIMIFQKNAPNELEAFKKSFYSVFRNRDPFEPLFQKGTKEKMVLYPTNGYFLTKEQFACLIKTLHNQDEDTFYISEIESAYCFEIMPPNSSRYQCNHWEIKLPVTYDEYIKLPIAIENALYSDKGDWGILISHEDHAMMGGNHYFILKFKDSYKKWFEDYKNFLNYWKLIQDKGINVNWLEKFIKSIN